MWGIVKAKLFYNRNRYRDTWSSWVTKDKTSRQLYIALSKAYISMYLKIKQNEVEKKKKNVEGQLLNGEKYLQIIFLIRDLVSELYRTFKTQ